MGGTQDPTGLIHLGARLYDSGTGRFISADPVLDVADPQQINGYAYARNNPATFSDPSGLIEPECWNGSANCRFDGKGRITSAKKKDNYAGPYGSRAEAVADAGRQNANCRRFQCGAPAVTVAPIVAPEPLLIPVRQEDTGGGFWNSPVGKGLQFLGEVIGINDVLDCVFEGDMLACGATVVTVATGGSGRLATLAARYGDDAFSLVRQGDELMACVRRHSFLTGTEVEMADGTSRDIEDLEVGDEILATDPETGESAARRVVATIITDSDKEYTDVTVRLPDGGTSSITAAAHHPFWDETTGIWTDAADLTPGTQLRTPEGPPATARTYNLTIEDLHTYYLLAGQGFGVVE